MFTGSPMLRRPHPSSQRDDGTVGPAANDQPAASQAQSNRTAFFLLVACAALINSDQNLLAPNMSACADEFGFNKQEKDEKLGGTLAAGLFLAGAPAAIAVGVAADGAMRRVDLLLLVLLIGSAGCLGSALAGSFWQLFAARALTGVSLGGGLPVTFSLMGDMFDPSERAVQSGRLGVAMGAGQMLGQALAGAIGPTWGWRAPFLCVSMLMLLLTLAIASLMREPPRDRRATARGTGGEIGGEVGGEIAEELALLCAAAPHYAASHGTTSATATASSTATSTTSTAAAAAAASASAPASAAAAPMPLPSRSAIGPAPGWSALFRSPTVWLLLLQGVPGCVPWGVISAFLPDYLHVEQARLHASHSMCPA